MRKLLAEFIGTYLLALAIVGAGAMATNLTQDSALQLFINALTAAGVLILIITIFGPLSGGHFNPAVTVIALVKHEISVAESALYIAAQILGGIAGVISANYLFGAALLAHKNGSAPTTAAIASEVLSTAGLLFVIRHLIHLGKSAFIPFGVALWIFTGYFFTPTSVVANPAMTISRAFTDTNSGIPPAAIFGFIAAQFIGALVGASMAQGLKGK